MKKEDKWINSIKRRLDGYTEPAPEQLWSQLERELSTPKIVPFYRRFHWIAAGVVILLVSSVTMWWISTTTAYDPLDEVAEQFTRLDSPLSTIEKSVAASDSLYEEISDRLPKIKPQMAKVNNDELPHVKVAVVEEQHIDNVTNMDEHSTSVDMKEKQIESVENGREEENNEFVLPVSDRSMYRQQSFNMDNKGSHMVTTAKKHVEFGLSFGNSPLSANNETLGYKDFASNTQEILLLRSVSGITVMMMNESVLDDKSVYAYTQVLSRNINNDVRSHSSHKMPVTVAATIRWHLTDRWSIETGLMYTQLVSEIKSGTTSNYYEIDQKLHYLGIPIKGNYRLWENKWFSVYVSAGGAVEKSISGKLTTRYTLESGETQKEEQDLNVKELQWSVSTAVGAQLKLTEHLGIYVEPGVNYYFKDGSGVETIRKEYPLNFNLQTGIRFSY